MTYQQVMEKLESLASHDPKDLAGMARFGINVDKAWVISMPKLRILAKEILSHYKIQKIDNNVSSLVANPGISPVPSDLSSVALAKMKRDPHFRKDDTIKIQELHTLALEVWDSGIHEARILAGLIDDPKLVTEKQMEKWALDFDSWDVCDQTCGNLFDRTEFAIKKAHEWSVRPEEFVKRAGFVLMAGLAVHDKKLEDNVFIEFLVIIKRESCDNRNFVRKAVNWALRNIGKSRNKYLYEKSIRVAEEILGQAKDDSLVWSGTEIKAMNFIAGDAKRELEKDYIKNRFL